MSIKLLPWGLPCLAQRSKAKSGEAYMLHTGWWFLLLNTPGTRVGSGFRDQTLNIKSRKNRKSVFFVTNY